MLRDRYKPQDIVAVVPHVTLALEPELQELDHLLDDDVLLYEDRN